MLYYPELAGIAFERTKTPQFKTAVKQSVSGYEVRAPLMAYPLWNFSLSYEFLRNDVNNDELKTLAGFYLQCKGAYSTFYFKDPFDHTVTDQAFGVGDGSSKSFQLVREFGGFLDLIQAPISPVISINGQIQSTGYTVSDKGVVTFTNAPSFGATLTWSGQFYYPCRFKDDQIDFQNFMLNLWEAKKVDFVSVKL